MKKYGLISAIVLIVLTNVVLLAGVVYNRSGEPDATVTLTERELHWQNNWNWIDREDSGQYLTLKWNMPGYRPYYWENPERNWLNEKKLMELGFDTSYPLDEKNASRFYSRQLPIQAYVVLEYNGDAYQNWLKKTRNRIKERQEELSKEKNPDKKKTLENDIRRIQQETITYSRLFAINGGRDPEVLRRKYPDQSKYIITPAVLNIMMHYAPRKKDQPKSLTKRYLSGQVRKVSVSKIHVTSDYRSFFISDIKTPTKTYLPRDKPLSDLEPRYQVTLNYGRRYEPWIVDVQKLK